MSKPAKDEAELISLIDWTILEHENSPGSSASAVISEIRAAGWAVVPARLTKDMEYDALRAENARLREALTWYVNHGAWPVELVRDGGETARAALEVKP